MPAFLYNIDSKFKMLLSKKSITKNDLLELKSYIIESYENDMALDIKGLNNMKKVLELDLYNL
jgi:hypothetical protein